MTITANGDDEFTEQSKSTRTTRQIMIISGVSLYGNTALIGHGVDHDNKENSGSVYVFTRPSSDGTFTQQSKFHASDLIISVFPFLCTVIRH